MVRPAHACDESTSPALLDDWMDEARSPFVLEAFRYYFSIFVFFR